MPRSLSMALATAFATVIRSGKFLKLELLRGPSHLPTVIRYSKPFPDRSGSISRGFRGEFRHLELVSGLCEASPIMANRFISVNQGAKAMREAQTYCRASYKALVPKQIHEIKDSFSQQEGRMHDLSKLKGANMWSSSRFVAPSTFTLCVFDSEKADKLKQSLPPGFIVQDL
ncbi:hypothetical protein IFM89_039867 [Coptis chinensis]|uniref:Uncharacterized protein n=1 Tax=Coptis chinensis TaxID=261450 RepID=A0A835LBZ7_9MAGN|nr:hypothetical protein IFM89_039867 [Coptis chinensis]